MFFITIYSTVLRSTYYYTGNVQILLTTQYKVADYVTVNTLFVTGTCTLARVEVQVQVIVTVTGCMISTRTVQVRHDFTCKRTVRHATTFAYCV